LAHAAVRCVNFEDALRTTTARLNVGHVIKAVSDAWVVDVNIEHGDGTITGVTFGIEADGALSARIAHFTTVSRPCR
jgi:hypothetical protein